MTNDEICAEKSDALSNEELNELRYAAGYVPRATRKKITKSEHPLKKDTLQLEETDGIVTDDSQDWINSIDHEGLIQNKNNTYGLFLSMEKKLRKSLNPPTFT